MASLAKTKEAIRKGIIPAPSKCELCDQTEGIIQYHNDDYSDPIKYLRQFCWRCHMMYHSKYRAPESYRKYFAEVKAGKRYPPVYRHDFRILERDHGVPGGDNPRRQQSRQSLPPRSPPTPQTNRPPSRTGTLADFGLQTSEDERYERPKRPPYQQY